MTTQKATDYSNTMFVAIGEVLPHNNPQEKLHYNFSEVKISADIDEQIPHSNDSG